MVPAVSILMDILLGKPDEERETPTQCAMYSNFANLHFGILYHFVLHFAHTGLGGSLQATGRHTLPHHLCNAQIIAKTPSSGLPSTLRPPRRRSQLFPAGIQINHTQGTPTNRHAGSEPAPAAGMSM